MMKVDLMYSIQYVPHPWDKSMREQGIKAVCLCKEVRLPVEEGHRRGKQIVYEPVALFNSDSEGLLFEEFCYSQVSLEAIEPRPEFVEMKREIDRIRSDRRR